MDTIRKQFWIFTVDDGIISALRHRSTINEEELIMDIVCLDLEGVLVPEIWIAFAEESGIPELKKTTRDEPDYDKLMNWRLGILK